MNGAKLDRIMSGGRHGGTVKGKKEWKGQRNGGMKEGTKTVQGNLSGVIQCETWLGSINYSRTEYHTTPHHTTPHYITHISPVESLWGISLLAQL